MKKAVARAAAVLLVTAGSWAVWGLGGDLMAWAGLDDIDLIGRVVLVFGFLTACEAVLGRFPAAFDSTHPS